VLTKFIGKVTSLFIESSRNFLLGDSTLFRQFLEALINLNLHSSLRVHDFPISTQISILEIIGLHCKQGLDQGERRIAFDLLRDISANPIVLNSFNSQTREAIVRYLLVPFLGEGHFDVQSFQFPTFVWFLFEFADDPLRNRGHRDKIAFLEGCGRFAPDVENCLRDKPLVRARWLRSVLRIQREPDIGPVFEPAFASLLANVIAVALGTPEIADFSGDREVLELFTNLLDSVEEIPITPQMLKFVTGKMKGTVNTQLFNGIFARLSSERFMRAFDRAIAGNIRMLRN
jgi:hypothetical protein